MCRLKGRNGSWEPAFLATNRKEHDMGKGNNSQKNDKKNLKPKKEKAKPAAKK